MSKKTYLIAAGGTGGHIHPGIAIADEIVRNQPDSQVIFCGTKTGMENKLVKQAGYEILHIDAKGLDISLGIKNILSIIYFIKGYFQSIKIIRETEALAVIGTGGYVCGPIVRAAAHLKIPVVLHEQNAFPGKANRWLSKYAQVVCVSYKGTEKYFKKAKNVVISGNPVRHEFFQITRKNARLQLNISDDEKIVLVTGGSLGASSINNAVLELVEKYDIVPYRIILVSGNREYDNIKKHAEKYKQTLNIESYLNDMHLYLAAADIILCRAGAITCSEIALLGKPSILIPYPYAAGDHQTLNAKAFSDINAAILIEDKLISGDVLKSTIDNLFSDSKKLHEMGELARTLSYPNSTGIIYSQVVETTKVKATKKETT